MILSKRPYITYQKTAGIKGSSMFRLFKVLVYLLIIVFIGLAAYTYVGPFFGVDFSAPQNETRVPVTLDAE